MSDQKKTVEEHLAGTEAGAIWNEIKGKPLEMFALPNQTIAQHASPVPVEPNKLYLLTRASSALPAIETAVGKNYTVELVDRYVVVSRTVVPLTQK
jgi:hypothetical protein